MRLEDVLQWIGAVGVIGGHVLNAVGPAAYPWNIVSFLTGTVFFMLWSTRVMNRPQTLVNAVALTIGVIGIYKAMI